MKKTSIYYKVSGLAVAALTLASCTDTWDDHYDTVVQGDGTTIWQTIASSNSNMQNFKRVMETTGYDVALNSSQVFTVFAPIDEVFTSSDADRIINLYNQEKMQGTKDKDNRAIKEFVQNHIALYNHSVAKSGADSIVMMNGKYLVLTPEALGSSPILTKNQQKSNGVLFTVGDQVKYSYNIFEYLSADQEIDSVGKFLTSYNEYEFNAKESVPGGIIDGKTWYLDSVEVLQNKLFTEIGRINSEDSTYWMLAPTNEVWDSLVAEYTPYFTYDDMVAKRDSVQFAETRLAILRGTVFSRTKNTDATIRDSALSVNASTYAYRVYKDQSYYQYDRPFDAGGVFSTAEFVPCSNGQVLKAADWLVDNRQTFFQKIIVEGESRNYLDGVKETTTTNPVVKTVTSDNPFYNKVSQNKFVLVGPTASSAAEVRFKLPNLLSNIGYDIAVVFAPAVAEDTLAKANQRVPVKFQASISYHLMDGKASAQCYLPENDSTLRASRRTNFETNPDKVDTVFLAKDIKFPTCSYGLDDTQVMLTLTTSLRAAEIQNETRTANMRIDCIIVRPHEEDEE